MSEYENNNKAVQPNNEVSKGTIQTLYNNLWFDLDEMKRKITTF